MNKTDTSPVVSVAHKGTATWLCLNRPDRLNAVNADMVEALIDGIDTAIQHGSSLIIFAGNSRAFSAGFDLSGLDQQSDADLLYRFVRVEQLLQKIYQLPVTSLALVQGRCFGAAADIVAACRHRIATPDASFRMPGLQFGIVLGTRRLSRLIGSDAALGLLETSAVFTAKHALDCGFLNGIEDMDNWPDLTQNIAHNAANLAPEAKAALLAASRDDSGLDSDLAALVRSAATPGLVNNIRNFVAKQVKK